MFVYRLSLFPFPLQAIFSPFPQTESLFTGYVESWLKSKGLHKEILNLTAARLAQLDMRRSAEREAAGSSPGRTNNQGL